MKTNMGQKWYQSTAYDFLYCRRKFFKKFYGFCAFKFKETVFGILQNFGVAFLDRVARAD
jgi:hypothetical protein